MCEWVGGQVVGESENKAKSAQLNCSLSWCWAGLSQFQIYDILAPVGWVFNIQPYIV